MIEIAPDWIRGYQRKSMALFGLGKYVQAKRILEKGLSLDPENESLLLDMNRINSIIREKNLTVREGTLIYIA